MQNYPLYISVDIVGSCRQPSEILHNKIWKYVHQDAAQHLEVPNINRSLSIKHKQTL